MSFVAVAAFVVFCVYMLSRFGKRIHAKNATSWWAVILFLFIGIVYPSSYVSIANMFGIQLVSNFVFAAMILFLLKTTLENAVDNTRNMRRLREMICSEAARRFCEGRPKPNPTDTHSASRVLVVLPTYNEVENIGLLRTLFDTHQAVFASEYEYQICFVNDASTDSTGSELEKYWPSNYVTHLSNAGVSGVLISGFKISQILGFDYVVQCDADGQHPVEKIPSLVSEAVRSNSDITIGSRFSENLDGHDALESTTLVRRFGGVSISFILRALFPVGKISDPTSGFRVYSKKAVELLLRSMPDDYPEPESIAICSQHQLKITEIPVRMKSRQGGETSISGFRSFEFMVKVFTSLLSLKIRGILWIFESGR